MSDEAQRSYLIAQVEQNQRIMMQAMHHDNTPEWLNKDMTMPQFKIIFLLFTHDRLRMSEIARTLDKNISTATGIVDRLVEQNLVKREEDPKDRRVVIAQLTDQGREVCESFLQDNSQQIQMLMNRLSLEELQTVARGIEILARVSTTLADERQQVAEAV